MLMIILLARYSELFPGPMTVDDRGRVSVTDERCRRVLDENVDGFVPGPMTGDDRGRDPVITERYRRDLDESVVDLRFSPADIAHGPSLYAEGGLLQDANVGIRHLHAERLIHVALVILNGTEAPV